MIAPAKYASKRQVRIHELELRRNRIQLGWSAEERDERARRAALQLLNLWALVHHSPGLSK